MTLTDVWGRGETPSRLLHLGLLTPLGFTLETAALAADRIPCWLSIQADVMGLYVSVKGAPVLFVTDNHP